MITAGRARDDLGGLAQLALLWRNPPAFGPIWPPISSGLRAKRAPCNWRRARPAVGPPDQPRPLPRTEAPVQMPGTRPQMGPACRRVLEKNAAACALRRSRDNRWPGKPFTIDRPLNVCNSITYQYWRTARRRSGFCVITSLRFSPSMTFASTSAQDASSTICLCR